MGRWLEARIVQKNGGFMDFLYVFFKIAGMAALFLVITCVRNLQEVLLGKGEGN